MQFWSKNNQKPLVRRSSQRTALEHWPEIIYVVATALLGIYTLSYCSFTPAQSTWLVVPTPDNLPANWCGAWGVTLASYAWLLLGYTNYLIIALAWLLNGAVILKRTHYLILQIMSSCGLSLCSAMLQACALNAGFEGVVPGYIGDWAWAGSVNQIGIGGSLVAVVTITWVSFIGLCGVSPWKLLSAGFGTLFATLQKVSGVCMSKFRSLRRTKKDAPVTQDQTVIAGAVRTEQLPPELVTPAPAGLNLSDYVEPERWAQHPIFTVIRPIKYAGHRLLLLPNSLMKTSIFALMHGASIYDKIMQAVEHEVMLAKTVRLPDRSIFKQQESIKAVYDAVMQEAQERAKMLEKKLEHFGVNGKVLAIRPGPVVTMFEYAPGIDNKISKIIALEDDLAMALKAHSMRILAPIPGKSVVGFEIANNLRHSVSFAELIHHAAYAEKTAGLPLALGVDVVGVPVVMDLLSMPHLLVAGSTGAGKSVGLHAMLASLLCAKTPDEMRLVLIDPKRLEFSHYHDIPHLLFPVVNDPRIAAPVLKWLVREMEQRYDTLSKLGLRNLADYHRLVAEPGNRGLKPMPFIVVMIDELADLMMVSGKEVEMELARLAQMARAAGIHLIVATQRPSVDVLTGVIKVNFPSRIGYRVTSKIDSRTILDSSGAEKLLGRGDMLLMHASASHLVRVHGAYISDTEVLELTNELRSLGAPRYEDLAVAVQSVMANDDEFENDPLYDELVDFIATVEEISISMIQRHYRIGFNRSARLIHRLEVDGHLAPAQGNKPRKVLLRQ